MTTVPREREEIPETIRRSPGKVRRTYEKALRSAHETYDSEEAAHRVAWSAVKHVAERRGDRWVLKGTPGPSDAQAARSGPGARDRPLPTAGGVDVHTATRAELLERARRLGVPGRSRMRKDELGRAIARAESRAG